jgi:hypothetical protein
VKQTQLQGQERQIRLEMQLARIGLAKEKRIRPDLHQGVKDFQLQPARSSLCSPNRAQSELSRSARGDQKYNLAARSDERPIYHPSCDHAFGRGLRRRNPGATADYDNRNIR